MRTVGVGSSWTAQVADADARSGGVDTKSEPEPGPVLKQESAGIGGAVRMETQPFPGIGTGTSGRCHGGIRGVDIERADNDAGINDAGSARRIHGGADRPVPVPGSGST